MSPSSCKTIKLLYEQAPHYCMVKLDRKERVAVVLELVSAERGRKNSHSIIYQAMYNTCQNPLATSQSSTSQEEAWTCPHDHLLSSALSQASPYPNNNTDIPT